MTFTQYEVAQGKLFELCEKVFGLGPIGVGQPVQDLDQWADHDHYDHQIGSCNRAPNCLPSPEVGRAERLWRSRLVSRL